MKIQFWGAAQGVTGSMHIIEHCGRRFALDCGIVQGKRKQSFELNRNFPLPPSELEAVVLSHAHIDHAGNLPTLVRQGFRGKIYATRATVDLANILLLDSAHIQESDVEYVNKKRRREGKQEFEPLYTRADAMAANELFKAVDYGTDFQPVQGVRCRFADAGHILGSAITSIDVAHEGKNRRLVFSGDLGRLENPILRAPGTFPDADSIIMESTYGGRQHDPVGDNKEALRRVVARVSERGGKVIIPAFSVGRTQEILFNLNKIFDDKLVPPLPVFLDSPLAIDATEIFRKHPECYGATMRKAMTESPDGDALFFNGLMFTSSSEESKRINDLPGPAIIISASGMCESGRILHHLINNLADNRNAIVFVGFQAENTLGRKIIDGENHVRVFGVNTRVAAEVTRIEGMSAHADHGELLGWLRTMRSQGAVTSVFLVHGEAEGMQPLATDVHKLGVPRVAMPSRSEEYSAFIT